MLPTLHAERHFTGSRTVRDLVLGMADGLTVPFALAAGLTGAIDATWIIVVAGLAEVAAGAIAMGLGGYLAARSDAEHYESERAREAREVHEKPDAEAAEVGEVLESYGVSAADAKPLVDALRRHPEGWVDFMMRFELGLERPDPRRALWSAVTIGGAYVAGGLIPLAPYVVLERAATALGVSAIVTLAALTVFGYVKGRYTGTAPLRSALQAVLIGGLAAGAAFAIARAIT
ncbi:MAG: VIT1/CCC1 transporter family protein [Candidatus Rokubacteria bacterium]|nr:VIT1/CCC1 transporter family protein [Candidatus Rokubacteria bacterium]